MSIMFVKKPAKIVMVSRFARFMNVNKSRTIMEAFMESQFGYCPLDCPLVWMFHSRNLNNEINRTHERTLTIAYNDKSSSFQYLLANGTSSSFQDLLDKHNSVTIHHRNIRTLATETYDVQHRFFPHLLNE